LQPTDFERFYDGFADGSGLLGQLAADFQQRLSAAHAGIVREECDFYHTMVFGDEVVHGVWDLRGGERAYLGRVDVAGLRVLEFGPATGYLSFHMERCGADVVCFDLPPGRAADIVPQEGHDLEEHRRLSRHYAERVRNSWWYGHRRLGSRCRAVYGDIYGLPRDLGRFDVATFGSTLLHLSRPFSALQQAAAVTDKAIVVTEPIPRVPEGEQAATLEFAPVDTTRTVVVWWQLMPGAVIRMLRVLGFLSFHVGYHVQKHHPHHALDAPAEQSLFFTVVAERHPGWAPRLPASEAEQAAERALREGRAGAPRGGPPPDREAALAELAALRGSWSWRLTRPLRALGSLLRRAGPR
jgi:O-methyltransferase